jgi:hypothetical protein
MLFITFVRLYIIELRFHLLSFVVTVVSLVLRRGIILRLPACNEVEFSVKIRRDRQRQLCLIALRFPHWVLDVSMPDAGGPHDCPDPVLAYDRLYMKKRHQTQQWFCTVLPRRWWFSQG